MNSLHPEAVAVNSAHFPAGTTFPYIWGTQDAENGELCVPELYFSHRDNIRAYAAGYESVAGPSLLSRQILEAK